MKKTAIILAILAFLVSTLGDIGLAMRNSSDAKNISSIQKILSNADDEMVKNVLSSALEKSGFMNVDQLNPQDSENAMVVSFMAGIIGLIVLVSLFFRKKKVSLVLGVIFFLATLVTFIITPSIQQSSGITAKEIATFTLATSLIGLGLYYYTSKTPLNL